MRQKVVIVGHLAETDLAYREESIQLVVYQAEEANPFGQKGRKVDKGNEGKNSAVNGERCEG